jgi:hypothetical protein
MALFEQQMEQITNQLESMSNRDRMLVVIIAVAGLALVAFLFNFLVGQSVRSRMDTNLELKRKLDKIMALEGQFQQARRKVLLLENRLKRQSIQLTTFLGQQSAKFGIRIDSINPVLIDGIDSKTKSRIKPQAVRISIQGADLASLARFLDALENSGKTVKIRQLKLNPNFTTPSKPDVTAQVVTYKLKGN